MIGGESPTIIFTFNVPFLGIPFLVIPLMIDDESGIIERKVDGAITIATDMVGKEQVQKPIGETLSVSLSAKKDSIFSTMVLPILKKILTATSVTDLTFGLITSGFNYQKAYTISYFSGNQYIIGGTLTAFDYGTRDNTDLVDVDLTITAPPSGNIASSESLSRVGGEIVNTTSGTSTAIASVATTPSVAPAVVEAVVTAGSLIPYPAGA